ncbi:MAG: RNA methyltransferase [Myxococcales bacterium]|nr:RNA methyltransferase [Myxococcales bacterium]
MTPADVFASKAGPTCHVLLDRGSNPHNLGAVARSAAYFGLDGMIVWEGPPGLFGAAARTAEGAAEHLPYWSLEDAVSFVVQAKLSGLEVLATSSHATNSVFDWDFARPRTLWLMGHEGSGLDPALQELADETLSIPGSSQVDSLNLSVAAAICFAEVYRRRA